MILLIDNYDSFVFNLVRYLRELGQETVVVRNDRLDLNDVEAGRHGDRPLHRWWLSSFHLLF